MTLGHGRLVRRGQRVVAERGALAGLLTERIDGPLQRRRHARRLLRLSTKPFKRFIIIINIEVDVLAGLPDAARVGVGVGAAVDVLAEAAQLLEVADVTDIRDVVQTIGLGLVFL